MYPAHLQLQTQPADRIRKYHVNSILTLRDLAI